MAVTSPDSIWTPDSGDEYALTVDLAAMADSIQDVFTDNGRIYKWANATARAAQTGMTEGDLGDQADTNEIYRYSGSAWQLVGGLPTTAPATAFSGWSTSSVFSRVGPIVVASGGSFAPTGTASITSSFTPIGSVPSGYRPNATLQFIPRVNAAQVFEVQIEVGGGIAVRTLGPAASLNTNSAVTLSAHSWIAGNS